MKKRVCFGIIIFLLLSACNAETEKTINDVTSNLKDQASNIIDMQDPHVLSVKTGHFSSNPDRSIGDAFQEFFGDPTWKYFKAESGNEIVEFTGHMMYQEAKVKARLQFILNDSKSFEIGALSFNDVPQNELIKASLMSNVFENEKATNEGAIKENQSIDIATQKDNLLKEDSGLKSDANRVPATETQPEGSLNAEQSSSDITQGLVNKPSPTPENKSLPNSLLGGRIPDIPSGIGDEAFTLFDFNGEVIKQVDTGTGIAYMFKEVTYYTTDKLNLNGNISSGNITAIRFDIGQSFLGITIGQTPQEIIKTLGKPFENGNDLEDGAYSMNYKLGDYHLYISAPDENAPTTTAIYKKD